MKSMLGVILTIWVAILTVVPNTAAQDPRMLTGHTSAVNSISFSPDGTLASGSEDGTIRLWDVDTGQHLRTITRHTNAVYSSISFSPDGKLLASVSWDSIRLWDVNAGELLRTLVEDTWDMWAEIVSFSPDGRLLASAGSEDTIRLWHADTGELLYILTAHTPQTFSVSFSPDGRLLASAGSEDTIRLWEVDTENDSRPLTGHTGVVFSVAWSPDGSMIASGSKDETVRIWDPDTEELLHTLTGHTDLVYSVAWSPDGTRVVSGSHDGTVRIWDAEGGKLLETLREHTGTVNAVAWSPDGTRIASASTDGTIWIWENPVEVSDPNAPVNIPDPNLRAAIEEELGKPKRATITQAEMETLTELYADSYNADSHIQDLTGLEFATNLTFLYLSGNQITDYSPLARLTNLRVLSLSVDQIRDISPLTELTKLESLAIAGQIRDISPLTGLIKLESLNLIDNQIRDISPLSGLTSLTYLYLSHNQISDVSPLAGLTNLTFLTLVHNQIRDISPLSGLTALTALWLENNQISDVSPLSGLPSLKSLGISYNQITDFSPIAELIPHLEGYLNNNQRVAVTLSLSPSPAQSPAIGEQLTLSLRITAGQSVAGYQATLQFDTTALQYMASSNGDYLPTGAFFIPPIAAGNTVTLAGSSLAGESQGDGTLATLTFEVVDAKASTVLLSEALLTDRTGGSSVPETEDAEIVEAPQLPEDVNADGIVNIIDLTLVASNFGKQGTDAADVNADGVVNIIDLTLVAAAFGDTAAAPILWTIDLEGIVTNTEVAAWLQEAREVNLTDPTSQRGILFLQQLLTALTPTETLLLPNYPNPFNPETWIPYQLAAPAEVTLTIFSSNGQLVRTLALGHKVAGVYQSKSRAAYWDGRNTFGERVASGLYFYTLRAGDFTATGKMLILK